MSTEKLADDVEEVVVTGIRESLGRARDIKRDATQFVDAIVADDIGKLPDRNVAESLARVSGVQVDRGISEGTGVSVRGLRQNVYLLNGRQIIDATGRGGNGLDVIAKSASLLSLVPSELISRLELTKLASSDQISGALGGIVDVQTPRPLGNPDRVAAKLGGLYYDQPSEAGYEGFALASHKFSGDALGVLVSASYGHRNLSQQGLDTFAGYLRFTDNTGAVRFGHSDAYPEEIAETRDNLGLNAIAEWQVSDRAKISVDTFYSSLESHRSRWWLSFRPVAGLSNATYSPNDILLSGTSVGPVPTNTEFFDADADIWSSAVRGSFEVSNRLRGSAEVDYTKATANGHQVYFRLEPIASITPSVDFDMSAGELGSYQVSGIDLTDPAQLRFTTLFDNSNDLRSENTAARTDWTYDLEQGFLKAASIGARYERLDSERALSAVNIRPAEGILATSLSEYVTLRSNPEFAEGEFRGLPRSYIVANGLVSSCSAFSDVPAISQDAQCLSPRNTSGSRAGTFEIKEGFAEGYGKLDFDTRIGSSSLSGNVGVRYLMRELESIGNKIDPDAAVTPTTFKRTDSDWLPSAVTKLVVGDDLIFRLGAARVIAYPNTADLGSGVSLAQGAQFVNGVQTVLGLGSGGAPDLDPFKADQVDLAAEYYFADQALVSLGLFYKDVSTFIVQRQNLETYGGTQYLINRKVNGESADVSGAEFLLQLPFYFMSGAFDGFGVIASYSYIDSSTPIKDVAGRTLPFPGLSPNNVNVVLYYEVEPISVRLAYNWRDDYLTGLSAAATGIYTSPYTDVSFTLRYDLTPKVSMGFEALNLIDAKLRTYDGVDEALRTNLYFGRIYKASVSMKF